MKKFWAILLLLAASIGGCRRAIVIVPQPDRSYTERDTLYGYHRGNRVVVSFRFDSVLRVDTVTRLDTLWRGGTRTIVRVDTVKVPTPVVTTTPSTPRGPTPTRIPDRPSAPNTGVSRPEGPRTDRPPTDVPAAGGSVRVDTVIITRTDTLIITKVDTVRVGGGDTVRVAGRRTLFVPPGHYPPEGLCRVWIHDLPPGRQADPTSCGSLGNIPAGAFILFGGDAWDADYDWVAESVRGGVPPEIIALSRRRRP